MVGVRVVEADNLPASLVRVPLNANQLAGIDAVAGLRRVGLCVGARHRGEDLAYVWVAGSEQRATALLRIGGLGVAQQGVELGLA